MGSDFLYSLLYLEVNVISLVLVALLHYKTSGLTKMVAQRNFAMAIDAQMVFFISDTMCVTMYYGLFTYIPTIVFFFKTVYFLSTSLMCFYWFVYFEHLQGTSFVKDRKRVLMSSVLVWITGLLLVVNIFTGMCFYIDDNDVYCRGPMFILLYIFSYAYVFFTCSRALVRMFKKQYYSQRRKLIKLALFPVGPAIAGIIQFINPALPLACAALAFATLIIYMDWTDEMISVDPLTNLNNRKTIDHYYEMWHDDKDDNASLYLLMVDANKFKSINDTYGHLQGDKALIRIADAMRLAIKGHHKRSLIARYGGDEFVILIWAENEVAVQNIIARIDRELRKLNKEANAPYDLTVSIGYEKASPDISLKDLIENADEHLYSEKAKLR
ncbi:MAG: GGDEF domain-containing protein [Clostridiales bacterium]|nr:GGDEF domain-containing protein [Clostridiales bacterium]